MVTQLVLIPPLRELVCPCKCQPRWSAGHDRSSELPTTTAVMFVGFVLTHGLPMTAKVPSIANRFDHCRPAHGNGGRGAPKVKPVTGWLNKVKESPTAKLVGPM